MVQRGFLRFVEDGWACVIVDACVSSNKISCVCRCPDQLLLYMLRFAGIGWMCDDVVHVRFREPLVCCICLAMPSQLLRILHTLKSRQYR